MTPRLASTALAATLAAALVAPAGAIDVTFDGVPHLMPGGQIHGIDLTGLHADDRPMLGGDRVAEGSGFMGEPVFLEDGESRLGTVDTVFLTEDDRARVAVRLADDIELSMADMVYVLLPEGAEPDGSITLGLTAEDLVGMSQNWAD